MGKGKRLSEKFFHRDCLDVAPDLVGKVLVSKLGGEEVRVRITQTECYRGQEDTACHASKGKTARNEVLYEESGKVYVYLCYGIHSLMNVITGEIGQPQGVLFRAGENADGPAKLTKKLGVERSVNRDSFLTSDKLWIEDDGKRYEIITKKRVGIDYATEEYVNKQWRFVMGREIADCP